MTSSPLTLEAPSNALAFYWRSLTEILQGQFRVFFVAPLASAWLEGLSFWERRLPTLAADGGGRRQRQHPGTWT